MNLRKLINCTLLLLSIWAMAASQDREKFKKNIAISSGVTAEFVGRFRVTMIGFTVNHQTADNILESDGKGDEVYITAEIAQYDGQWQAPNPRSRFYAYDLSFDEPLRGRGNLTMRRSLSSVVMGDVNNQSNPPRIRAGSAGDQGGLRTGDRFPTDEPWNMRGAPRTDRLPMLLWEGTLNRGRDLVIIVPLLWEWDGGNPRLRSQLTLGLNNYFSSGTYHGYRTTWGGFTGGDAFGAGDRPIGMLANHSWSPSALTLNFENAQAAATTSPSNIGTGVVELRYMADDEDYTVYFKIERVS